MRPGQFAASMRRGKKILGALELLDEDRLGQHYVRLPAAEVRNASYPELWQRCIRDGLYDARLIDQSFFQFQRDDGLSYSYYEAPVRAQSFEEFAYGRVGEEWPFLADELQMEYEAYLNALPFEWPATPIRFDYSERLFRTPCHPVAHLHFGYSSEIRVATRRLLSPEAFVLFVIRQYFPRHWERLVVDKGNSYVGRRCRQDLLEVELRFWTANEDCEIHLS